ncbi:hypothetical protein DSO57_1018383 [Entomophthora muscae]|uniref:Uncharacterized protein n=1 Tax=Entomophthora muscae TaxID=34485 RepID=A0ACC2T4E6_9FUNG|nr:hypothetical protein DSO57_1018383 [Entomophthora muscae]
MFAPLAAFLLASASAQGYYPAKSQQPVYYPNHHRPPTSNWQPNVYVQPNCIQRSSASYQERKAKLLVAENLLSFKMLQEKQRLDQTWQLINRFQANLNQKLYPTQYYYN